MSRIDRELRPPLADWPDQANFIAQRDNYVRQHWEENFHTLQEAGYEEQLIPGMLEILLRGEYVFNMMHTVGELDPKYNVDWRWITDMPRHIRGGMAGQFFIDGQEVPTYPDLLKVALERFEQIELRGFDINMSLWEVKGAVDQAIRFHEMFLRLHPDKLTGAEEVKKELIEEAAIKFEASVVHEFSHVLFIASVYKNKANFIKWLTNHQDYNSLWGENPDTVDTQTVQEKYYEKRIETKGRVLPKLFLAKYYPDFKR